MNNPAPRVRGRLLLVPAPLDFGCEPQPDVGDAVPGGTLRAAAALRHWVCENAKTTRAYLKRIAEHHPLACPLQDMQMQELPREVHKKGDHTGQFDARPLLAPALAGQDVGLVSEAGIPAVADPGSSVVRAAHDLGIEVVALPGAGAVLLALAASGMNGQNFAFVGYLPQDAAARVQRIRELESFALKSGQTQLFIETPYRNAALWQALLQTLQHNTRLSVSSGLSLAQAQNHSRSVKAWRQQPALPAAALPAVFAIGR